MERTFGISVAVGWPDMFVNSIMKWYFKTEEKLLVAGEGRARRSVRSKIWFPPSNGNGHQLVICPKSDIFINSGDLIHPPPPKSDETHPTPTLYLTCRSTPTL